MGGPATPRPAVVASPAVTVYVHAHADDWQLFMGDRASASLRAGKKVVFLYTDAGDAGNGAAYWQARERGALASVDTIVGAGSWTCAKPTIRTHPVRRCVKGSNVSYFMRMPSGNATDGTGYGFGSLKLLRDRGTATPAIDNSTTYTSWADFIATVGGILDMEAAGQSAGNVAVHAPDYDRVANPGDHNDHWATGEAVRAAAAMRTWNMAWYVDYHTQDLPANVTADAHAIKRAEFLAYDKLMVASGYSSLASIPKYQAWLWRTYARAEPEGAASPVGRYEAEAASLLGARVATDVVGFTGAGFADYRNLQGDYVEWRVYAPSAGSYTLTFRYGLGAASGRPLEIRVNGQAAAASLGFAPTGSWSTWKTVSLAATLQTGLNAVRATAIGWSGANVDNLSVQPR